TDWALAFADVSTGELSVLPLTAAALADELARVDPAELLLTEGTRTALGAFKIALPPAVPVVLPDHAFDSTAAASTIAGAFADGSVDPTAWSRVERAALGALIGYLREAQKGVAVALRPPRTERLQSHMAIDAATRGSLELLETQRGTVKGSLLGEIDHCVTPAGSRLLARRLAAPLCEARPVNRRLDAVERLCDDTILRTGLRATLKSAPDLTRAVTRLALGRGGPRDLLAVARAVAAAGELSAILGGLAELPEELDEIRTALASAPLPLAEELGRAVDEDAPLLARDGSFVRRGYHEALDAERALASETRAVVAALQARLVAETDVKALKIRHNGVLGYFVEVPATYGARLLEEPHRGTFIHRQTMANAMRFTTAELAELEGRIARAHEKALEIEAGIFARLVAATMGETDRLRAVADAVAALDVAAGLAHLAATRGFARPSVDDTLAFDVRGGRHPVVESTVKAAGHPFVANDTDLSGGALWLVTGPNMGGKSTFLRQNALLAILAQTGSFVPADRAHVGVVDRVFSRVGASDDIAGGRSTFMVEMVETAAILNRATARSLVILDEIGRGTATFDGLSIAWAAVEALHDETGCRGLFATHFHEMTALAKTLKRVRNVTVAVREWEGEVVFLHEVVPGAADRSYGIQVARLAGLPERVLARAKQVLGVLESRASGGAAPMLDDLPLFAAAPAPRKPEINPLNDMLDQVRPDELTPRQALDLVYELKKARDAGRRS
ncbi:MAG TPA: DNA mismatch repair protein MutS, partial [Devosia sp.]|nr:DNA mismatch repair protein MutS [Devosia sp.]